MMQHQHIRAAIAACILITCAGTASATIIECIDTVGAVTYTDGPCNRENESAQGPVDAGSVAIVPAAAERPSTPLYEKYAAAEQQRAAAWAIKRAALQEKTRDVKTMQAARTSMVLLDDERAMRHQQAAAALKL